MDGEKEGWRERRMGRGMKRERESEKDGEREREKDIQYTSLIPFFCLKIKLPALVLCHSSFNNNSYSIEPIK